MIIFITLFKPIFIAAVLFFSSFSYAGSDHGDERNSIGALSVDTPKRQANGNLFIPKLAQRQLKVETELTQEGDFPKTLDLAGKVMMDPNYGGKVQAVVAGRITPGPKGFPLPGQSVTKGDVDKRESGTRN